MSFNDKWSDAAFEAISELIMSMSEEDTSKVIHTKNE